MPRRQRSSAKGPSRILGAPRMAFGMVGSVALFGGRAFAGWRTTARSCIGNAAFIPPQFTHSGLRQYAGAIPYDPSMLSMLIGSPRWVSTSHKSLDVKAGNGGRTRLAESMPTGWSPPSESKWPESNMGIEESSGLEDLDVDPEAEAIFFGDKKSFNEIGLGPELCSHLESLGLVHSTAIQAAAIPGILSGEDLIVGAETGSGKTLAYLLPIVQRLLNGEAVCKDLPEELLGNAKGWSMFPDVVVLVPNKELAEQVLGVLNQILTGLAQQGDESVTAAVMYGSSYEYPYSPNQPAPSILVCTPTFLHKYTNMKAIPLFCKATTLVMDEADMLMDGSYKRQLDDILVGFRRSDKLEEGGWGTTKTQYVLAAATLPTYGLKSVDQYIKRAFPMARKIQQIHMHQHHPAIQQEFIEVGKNLNEKIDAVIELLRERNKTMHKTLVFANTATACKNVHMALEEEGFSVVAYHKDIVPYERMENLEALRKGSAKILVCTDLAARGIDIPSVTNIVQMEFATNVVHHLHRLGRAARAGRRGMATNFYDESSKDLVDAVKGTVEGARLDGSFSRKRGFRNKFKRYGASRTYNSSNPRVKIDKAARRARYALDSDEGDEYY